jgi:hypothetical protein
VPLVPDKKIARTADRSRKRHGSYPEFRGIEMRREVEMEQRWKIIENTAVACHCRTAEPRFVRRPRRRGAGRLRLSALTEIVRENVESRLRIGRSRVVSRGRRFRVSPPLCKPSLEALRRNGRTQRPPSHGGSGSPRRSLLTDRPLGSGAAGRGSRSSDPTGTSWEQSGLVELGRSSKKRKGPSTRARSDVLLPYAGAVSRLSRAVERRGELSRRARPGGSKDTKEFSSDGEAGGGEISPRLEECSSVHFLDHLAT